MSRRRGKAQLSDAVLDGLQLRMRAALERGAGQWQCTRTDSSWSDAGGA